MADESTTEETVESEQLKTPKRVLKSFSFKEKIQILKRLETEPQTKVSKELGLHARTLQKWRKQRNQIEATYRHRPSRNRKRNRKAKYHDVDRALYEWYAQAQARGDTVTGMTLKNKALIFNKEFKGIKHFKASDGWLDRWKARHDIKLLSPKSAESKETNLDENADEPKESEEIHVEIEDPGYENVECDDSSQNEFEFSEIDDPLELPTPGDDRTTDKDPLADNSSSQTKQLTKKLKNLTFKDKLLILNKLDNQVFPSINGDLRIPKSTLLKWKNDRMTINNAYRNGVYYNRQKRRRISAQEVQELLYQWFCKMKTEGANITDCMLKEKALEMYKKSTGNFSFKASDIWLSKWKHHYKVNLADPNVLPEIFAIENQGSNDPNVFQEHDREAVENHRLFQSAINLRKVLKNEHLTRSQLFNLDEIKLSYKSLTIFDESRENNDNDEEEQSKLTVGICYNGDGSCQLPPFVIGQSSDVTGNDIPICYYQQANAKLDFRIFEHWFKNEFVPKVRKYLQDNLLPLKVCLVTNNCGVDMAITIDNIGTMQFSEKFDSIAKAIHRAVTGVFRQRYIFQLVTSVKDKHTKLDVIDHLNTMTIKDAVNLINLAWQDISAESIHKHWDVIWPCKIKNLITQTRKDIQIKKVYTLNKSIENQPKKRSESESVRIGFETLTMLRKIQGYEKITYTDISRWVGQIHDWVDKVVVKQERPDEAEIRELAAKMVEANKAKMVNNAAAVAAAANLSSLPGQQSRSVCGILSQPTLPGILGYMSKTNTNVGPGTKQNAVQTPSEGKLPLDDESQRGRFGWTSFNECHIPYIFRGGEQYCAVRILESKLLNKYLSYLHSDIYSCTCIRSYYITEAESKLFNEINVKHCESQFGREQFTCRDLVVRLSDAKEFYTFLDVCYNKLTAGTNPNSSNNQKADKCGFIRINKESVVPYTVKDGLQYVPLFYFEGETDNLKLKAEKLQGWDLSYLKFCCKVQGIRNELFASETCSVISLSDIKSYFPPGTGFEDYWPHKVMDSQLLVSSKGNGSGGSWTKQPPTPPSLPKTNSVQNNSNKNVMNSARSVPVMPNIMQRGNTVSAAQLQRAVGQPRPVVTTHPALSSSSVVQSNRTNIVTAPMLNTVQGVVNGWSGLVGGQPTFQTALVSQANPIIRMPNTSLSMHNISASNKSYSQQSRNRGGSGTNVTQYPGVYPVTTMQTVAQAQPPPLVRATAHTNQQNLGAATTYTTPSLGVTNAVAANTYPQMLGLSEQVQALMPVQPSTSSLLTHSQRHTQQVQQQQQHQQQSVHNSSHNKYPPPLIPVNGNNSNTRDSRGRKPLVMIPETQTTPCHVQPYQIQKALVEDKMVPCINFKPYIYSELLMTLPDFVSQYFPACDINSCRQVLTDVLLIDLYQGNRSQMKMLMEAGKCSSLNEELPLIQVRSVMKYMPQLKYIINRGDMVMPISAHSSEEHPSKKRQRTS